MNANIFLATIGNGLARASRTINGDWPVEIPLTDQDVRCLASDSLNPNVV